MDNQDFSENARDMASYIVKYEQQLKNCELPVRPNEDIKPGYLWDRLPSEAPEAPESFREILTDIDKAIMPGITHWQHPRFFAYYPTASSHASILGDMLSGSIACIGFSWIASPACTELEVLTIDWLVKAMNLPSHFLSNKTNPSSPGGGVIQPSASDASIMIVLSLRSRKLRELNLPTEESGAAVSKMVVYFSDQAHSSVERACRIGLVHTRIIPTSYENGYKFDAALLEAEIIKDIAQGQKYGVWSHVDAAYAGSALLCEEFRYLADGIELVDSFNFNAHKSLQVCFDCSILWVREKNLLENAFVVDPVYLQNDYEGMPEYRHWQTALGRRFRALKVWFVLRMYGLSKLRNSIREHVMLAQKFRKLIEENCNFEIVNKGDFGLICFRYKGSDEDNRKFYKELMKSHEIFLVPGEFSTPRADGTKYFMRFVCGIGTSSMKDVEAAFVCITKCTEKFSQLQ